MKNYEPCGNASNSDNNNKNNNNSSNYNNKSVDNNNNKQSWGKPFGTAIDQDDPIAKWPLMR